MAASKTRREEATLIDFANAIRECLGLAPLGGDPQQPKDEVRFHRDAVYDPKMYAMNGQRRRGLAR